MAKSFAELKRQSKESTNHLRKMVEKMTQKFEGRNVDERFWQPSVDEHGNGNAIIRFLPAPLDKNVEDPPPFVRFYTHSFQGPSGLWYIENCRSSLKRPDSDSYEDDPVMKFNSRLYKTGLESDKDQARKQKRKINYVSNILVVRDPAKPENEGKVFLFKYGKKIFDKIAECSEVPEFEDDVSFDPFNLWTGASFRLRIRKVDGYRNYDKSEFDPPAPIGDDDFAQEIWGKCYDLNQFIDPSNFKSYEELESKLNRVLELDSPTSPMPTRSTLIEDDAEEQAPAPRHKAAASRPTLEDDDDDDLAKFKRVLADDDE